ncbi:MAG: xanthine dehydrogenase subunit XdhC [Bacillota bacterium]
MKSKKITFKVNGKEVTLEVDVRESLLDVLRKRLQLTGVKRGCSVGECGACTVIIDGENIDSCIYLAVWADGKEINTIEGEAKDGKLSRVQQAFVEEGAIQCGFCTPGFVMSTTAMLKSGRKFTPDQIKKGLSGHMCRCTGYKNIIKAAEKALED